MYPPASWINATRTITWSDTMEDEVRTLQERYQEVARIGQEINHQLSDVGLLVKNLKAHIGRVLGTNYSLLLAEYQPQSNVLDLYVEEENLSLHEPNYPLTGASQYVIETQERVFIHHLSEEADQHAFQLANLEGTDPKESLMYVPLVLQGEALGVLSIQHPEPNVYTREDLFILELLANHIALALHNTRLYQSLSKLNETGQFLMQQFDSPDAVQAITNKIYEVTQADAVVLYPYDHALQRFVSPPGVAGMLYDPTSPLTINYAAPDHIALLALQHPEAVFAKESIELYTILRGDTTHERQEHFYQSEQICSVAAIPLRVDDNSVGVLFVNFRQPHRFEAPQRQFIEGLAHFAAVAIKNVLAFGRQSRRRLQELEILQKIDRELSQNLDLESVLDTILKLAHEYVPAADEAAIFLHNPLEETLTVAAATGRYANRRKTVFLQSTKGITLWVLHNKKPARVNNVLKDLPWKNLYRNVADDTISELDVPLLDGEEVVGVLNFESRTEADFSQEDEQFLVTLAGQAVLAIKNAQTYEREKQSAARFELLYEAGQELGKIANDEELQQAYGAIIRIAEQQSQSPVVIRRYDETTQELVLAGRSRYRHSPPSPRIPVNHGYNGQAAQTRRAIVIPDTNHPPPGVTPIKHTDPTLRSIIVTPIQFKDNYYGNLELTHQNTDHFRGADIAFYDGLAQQLGSTIYRLEMAKASQELEQRALSAEEMSAIGQSAFEITHRLGNDLGLVESYVMAVKKELAKRTGTLSPTITEKLDSIVSSVNKVLTLSRQLKQELTRFGPTDKEADEAYELEILPAYVLLEEALTSTTFPLSITTKIEVEEDLEPLHVWRNLVNSILHNLIRNAIDAMPDGGQLTLSARNGGRSIALEVTDTGVGIPEEKMDKIFNLFYSTKGSSGFGLWSARRHALRCRGYLKAISTPGQGTTFTLLLPR
jgi:GAF domain-containing protein